MTGPTPAHLRAFAQHGYVVIPNVVPSHLRDAAMQEIDRLIAREPPPADKRGFHFYWRDGLAASDPLLALLTTSAARDIAAAMIHPLRLAVPTQAQVSLNIPPWRHRPGGPHLDGLTPPEPDGRPGTFTLLAGILPHRPGRGRHGESLGLARLAPDLRILPAHARAGRPAWTRPATIRACGA